MVLFFKIKLLQQLYFINFDYCINRPSLANCCLCLSLLFTKCKSVHLHFEGKLAVGRECHISAFRWASSFNLFIITAGSGKSASFSIAWCSSTSMPQDVSSSFICLPHPLSLNALPSSQFSTFFFLTCEHAHFFSSTWSWMNSHKSHVFRLSQLCHHLRTVLFPQAHSLLVRTLFILGRLHAQIPICSPTLGFLAYRCFLHDKTSDKDGNYAGLCRADSGSDVIKSWHDILTYRLKAQYKWTRRQAKINPNV